jgi:hypothetical protein
MNGGFEAGTSADRSDFQIQVRVLRMSAVVHQGFRRHHGLPYLHQLVRSAVGLSEVNAKPALAIMYLKHRYLQPLDGIILGDVTSTPQNAVFSHPRKQIREVLIRNRQNTCLS